MTDVSLDIVQWLKQQPSWLQLIANKLVTIGSLSDGDLHEAIGLLKGTAPTISQSPDWAHLVTSSTTMLALKLASVSDVQGIENLSPRIPLRFGDGNLTVVYGHNGSGKSGYTRLLKRLCGKPRSSDLKSNVFLPEPDNRGCKISFSFGTDTKTVDWQANSQPISELTGVDFFDSDEAQNYLTKENNASYMPPLVALFERLVEACDKLKSLLQAEQGQLRSKLPSLPSSMQSTESGAIYLSLNSTLNLQRIQQYLNWTADHDAALELLVKRLNTDNPATLAVQSRNKKTAVDHLIKQSINVAFLMSSENLSKLRNLRSIAIDKRRIAEEAGKVASAKLDGVGSKTWLAMWEAAREYSQIAYPGISFPVNKFESARCVFCHQELKEDAAQRLDEFESFVQGKLEAAAKAAELAYSTVLNELIVPPSPEQLQMELNLAGLSSEDWRGYFVYFWQEYQNCRMSLLNHEISGQIQFSVDVSQHLTTLQNFSKQLEVAAIQFTNDAAQFDRQLVTNQKIAFETHKWISQQADAVRAEQERLNLYKQFDTWIEQLNPRKLTIKAAELSETLITKAYVVRFNQEIGKSWC